MGTRRYACTVPSLVGDSSNAAGFRLLQLQGRPLDLQRTTVTEDQMTFPSADAVTANLGAPVDFETERIAKAAIQVSTFPIECLCD